MKWTVETLNETVDAEVEALPADMRARLTYIAKLIEEMGLERVGEPHVSISTVVCGKCGSQVEAEFRGRFMWWQQAVAS